MRTNEYNAIIAHFGNSKNLIKAPGFFDTNKDEEGFLFSEYGVQSVISSDGKFVAPAGTDGQCYDIKTPFYGRNFPGVWDIEKKKKIIFKAELDDSGRLINEKEINKKCNELFSGDATFEELGGQLE